WVELRVSRRQRLSVQCFWRAGGLLLFRLDGSRFIHCDELADSHEFESFCQESVEGRRHGVYRLFVDVMRQNYRSWSCSSQDALGNNGWARPLPIERINRPENGAQAKLVPNPFTLALSDRAIRGPNDFRG